MKDKGHLNPDVGDVPMLVIAAILDERRQQFVIRQGKTNFDLNN